MFDATLRSRVAPAADRAARFAHARHVSAGAVTGLGLGLGIAAAVLAAAEWWWAALAAWLASRIADGLDGAIARIEGPLPRGGFVDLMADFTVYAAFVVGVAVAVPEARLAAVVLLAGYYVSGTAFLLWAALGTTGTADLEIDDDRGVRFVGGLAEGFETIVAYCVVCLVPDRAEVVLWVFAAMVAMTALQRVTFALTHLHRTR